MPSLALTDEIIENVKKEAALKTKNVLKDNLEKCILYGSCARGDFTDDSDIDIALLVNCSRSDAKKYSDNLTDIATEFAIKYFAVVNFVCIPYEEYIKKNTWYMYFKKINEDGVLIDG